MVVGCPPGLRFRFPFRGGRSEGAVRRGRTDGVSSPIPSPLTPESGTPLPEPTATLVDTARLGSGLGSVYRALDLVVDGYGLDDAALVVDVPGLGRQVLHAGRRPIGDDTTHLHDAADGLYTEPPIDDPVVQALVLALGALALRYDARPEPGIDPGERGVA